MEFTKRQIEIIHAATELIGEKGIQNLTTKSLAERMQFSEPALYRHFKDKNQILSSVILFFKEELKKKVDEIQLGRGSGREKMEKIVEFLFGHFRIKPAVVMVIFAETSFQFDEGLSKAVHELLVSMKSRFIRIIEIGQQDGSVRSDIEPSALVNIFMGGIRFTVLQWRISNFSTDLENDGHVLLSTFHALFSVKAL